MANITIKAGLNSTGFRSGLKEMESEARKFRDAFRKNIENGGGLFGSIDAALGKLATGRFAGPIAAIGAAMFAAREASDYINKRWENIAAATDRARQNVEAIQATRGAVAGQRFQGDAATAAQARSAAARADEAAQAAREAGALGDPNTFSGASRMCKFQPRRPRPDTPSSRRPPKPSLAKSASWKICARFLDRKKTT